jgi:hypothetical protein
MASTKSSGQELDNGSLKQPYFSACRTDNSSQKKMGDSIHQHRFFWDKFLVLQIYELQENCDDLQESEYYSYSWQ